MIVDVGVIVDIGASIDVEGNEDVKDVVSSVVVEGSVVKKTNKLLDYVWETYTN